MSTDYEAHVWHMAKVCYEDGEEGTWDLLTADEKQAEFESAKTVVAMQQQLLSSLRFQIITSC